MNGFFSFTFKAAFMPAMIPCAPASSYPVVPLICPAKNKLLIFFVSNESVNSVGGTTPCSIEYPGRAIPHSGRLNLAGVHRRKMHIISDNIVGLLIRMRNMARDQFLAWRDTRRAK